MTKSQLLFHQIYIPSIVLNLINNQNQLWRIVRLTSFQKPTISLLFNLLRVCPSTSTSLFAVLFIISSNALNYYCYVSLKVAVVPTVRILINFVTVLDCKTAGFFLKISKEIDKAWVLRARSARASHARPQLSPLSGSLFSASFQTFCLTARTYFNTQKYGLFCSLWQYQNKVFFFRRNSKPTAETSNAFRPQKMWWRHGLQHSSWLLSQTYIKVQSGDQNMLQVGGMFSWWSWRNGTTRVI